jgi:SAM-dependent methyltransferase
MSDAQRRSTSQEVDEPLAVSAPLAWARAPDLCPPADEPRHQCVWYHRVWQYLRLLDVITSVRTNADFLISFFRERARRGGYRRVLIAAGADYSLLAHVAHAYRLERAPLSVTFIDRCGTAVFLNRWYADRMGIDLETCVTDAIEYTAAEPFDVICSHNFLNRFLPDERIRLLTRWHESLRKGGVALTTQRIRPNATYERDSYGPSGARALAAQVERAARAYEDDLGVDPAELGAAVYEYAIRKGGWVIRTNEEVSRAFEVAGFHVDRADFGGGAEERARDKPSSKAGPDTYRMRIVATRGS